MSNDISGYGLQVTVVASVTFPQGITLTQFADDADPLDFPSIELAKTAMGLNGDLITYSTAQPLPMTLNIIPNTDDDRNMQVLAEANRVGKGKQPARDEITATVIYPDGSTKTMTNGAITAAIIGNAVASAGRMKSKPYIFAFENQGTTN